MVSRKTLNAIVVLVGLWVTLFLAPFVIPQIAWPVNIEIGIIVSVVMIIFSIIYLRSKEEEEGEGPIVELKGTTRDIVHDVVDETGNKGTLVKDDGGLENQISSIRRKNKAVDADAEGTTVSEKSEKRDADRS